MLVYFESTINCDNVVTEESINSDEYGYLQIHSTDVTIDGTVTATSVNVEDIKVDRNIRICCAIELDKDNNIAINPKSPCLFCSLPLVGSEVFELPFIINSPDFEPDSERQTILLDGNDINEETKKISDPGINKMILLKSQEMFKKLMKYICANDIKNRYLLLRGLKSIPNIERFFDYFYKSAA